MSGVSRRSSAGARSFPRLSLGCAPADVCLEGVELQTGPGCARQRTFPTDEAAMKLLFFILNGTKKEWTMPARERAIAKAQFAIFVGKRITKAMN